MLRAVVVLVLALALTAAATAHAVDLDADMHRVHGARQAHTPPGSADLEWKRAQVLTSASSTVNGTTDAGLTEGVLSVVSIVAPANVPRGRIYGEVQILDFSGTVLVSPWKGYVHSGGTPSAFPGVRVYHGQTARFVATQSSAGAAVRLTANLGISAGPVDGWPSGVFFYEAAGEAGGSGEIRSLDRTPAAGANPTTLSVGTVSHVRLVGAELTLVTDATATNRTLRLRGRNSDGTVWRTFATSQAASLTRQYGGGQGAPIVHTATLEVSVPIPTTVIRQSGTFDFPTENLQAADQWSGSIGIEEWAVPT